MSRIRFSFGLPESIVLSIVATAIAVVAAFASS